MKSEMLENSLKSHCLVCNGREFTASPVLWDDLIQKWELDEFETAYINRQQGCHCTSCGCNLRTLALAKGVMRAFGFKGIFSDFCETAQSIHVLEINKAGMLSNFLKRLKHHQLIEFPHIDLQDLMLPSGVYDVVIHSDTLEHIEDADKAMAECCRILKEDGVCVFTVPVIVDRLTRRRDGLQASYHGQPNVSAADQLVHFEFGSDVWNWVLRNGFSSCEIVALEYPSALSIIARKK